MTQSVNWTFTDFKSIDWESVYSNAEVRYVCYGEETCPESGRKHNQGWIQFYKKKRRGGAQEICEGIMKKHIIHMENCRGTEAQNNKYCQKENQFKTMGEFIVQGQRIDLDELGEKINSGMKLDEVIEKHFSLYCRYRGGIEKAIQRFELRGRNKFRKINTTVLWGKTGTGKTRRAVEFDPDNTFKICASDMK